MVTTTCPRRPPAACIGKTRLAMGRLITEQVAPASGDGHGNGHGNGHGDGHEPERAAVPAGEPDNTSLGQGGEPEQPEDSGSH